MKPLLPLLAASLLVLGLSLAFPGAHPRDATALRPAARASLPPLPGGATPSRPRARRVFCARPANLRLRRFEDGSARLECAGRLLVAVAVPR